MVVVVELSDRGVLDRNRCSASSGLNRSIMITSSPSISLSPTLLSRVVIMIVPFELRARESTKRGGLKNISMSSALSSARSHGPFSSLQSQLTSMSIVSTFGLSNPGKHNFRAISL